MFLLLASMGLGRGRRGVSGLAFAALVLEKLGSTLLLCLRLEALL